MDLKFELTRLVDESPIRRDGTVEHVKRADFFLGKFGPFTERFPRDEFTMAKLTERVEQLRAELRSMPQ